MKPVIIVPGWVMRELSPDELNQIVLHELAHLHRWDDWTNLAQKVVKALFFFHPAVWWIEKRVSLEREMACDDAVITETASPRAYAECLAHLAEKMLLQRSVALAQAALGRIRQTSLRVAQILDVNRSRDAARAWKPAVSLVAGFAVACVLCISKAPRLIAFDSVANRAPMIAILSPSIGSGRASTATPTPDESTPREVSQRQPVRLVQAKLNPRGTHPSLASSEQAPLMQPATSERRTGSIVRQTDVRLTSADATPVAFTESLFVVIEGSDDGSPDRPVYQIQLWRVMVLHPVVDPNSNRIPPKRT
jgi:hypothetical protein